MGVPTTMNPRFKEVGSGRRRCWGCNLKEISQWCNYRFWPDERRSGYAFRMFTKIYLLPTCRRDNFEYKERDIFVKKYCDFLGINPSDIYGSSKSSCGGKRGKKAEEMVWI